MCAGVCICVYVCVYSVKDSQTKVLYVCVFVHECVCTFDGDVHVYRESTWVEEMSDVLVCMQLYSI